MYMYKQIITHAHTHMDTHKHTWTHTIHMHDTIIYLDVVMCMNKYSAHIGDHHMYMN